MKTLKTTLISLAVTGVLIFVTFAVMHIVSLTEAGLIDWRN